MKKQFLGRFRKTDPANIMNPENYNRHLEQVEEGEASEYKGTESGRYFADLCMGAEWNVLARIPELHLAGGVWYSLYVIGNAEQWNVRLVMDGTI